MATLSVSRIKTFNPACLKSWGRMSARTSSPAPQILKKLWALSSRSWLWSSKMWETCIALITSQHWQDIFAVEEVLYFWSASSRWQECATPLPRIKLSVYNSGQAIHLHYAHATGWGLEPDSIQPFGLHSPCLRNELHRNTASANPRQLPNSKVTVATSHRLGYVST